MASQIVGSEPGDRPERRRSRMRVRWGAVPDSIWAITALWTVLLLGASVLWPMSYGYDEVTHIDMAYEYSVHPFHFSGPGQLYYSVGVVNMQHLLPGIPPHQRFSTAPIAPRDKRPTLVALGGTTRETGGVPNQMVQHPPLYYWLAAVVMRLPGVSGLSWDLEVWLMRLVSVAVMIPIPWLCWDATRRLLRRADPSQPDTTRPHRHRRPAAPDRLAVLAAVIPLSVPNLIRDGSAVSNDSLLILTTSLVAYMLVRVMTGDVSRRTATWLALALAAALWTKGFALVLPPIVLLAYLCAWRDHARRARHRWSQSTRDVLPSLVIAGVGGLVGGFWWIRDLIDYHTVQINGYGAFQKQLYGTPTNKGTLRHFVSPFLRGLFDRVYGGIGIPDKPSPGPVIIDGWPIFLLIGLLVAMVVGDAARRRARLMVLLAFPVLTLGVVAEGSFGDFHKWGSVLANQGRYLYSAVLAVAAVAAVGWARLAPKGFSAGLTPVVLIAAVATNAASWILILRSWYQPLHRSALGGLLDAAHGVLRWSPLPYGLTLTLVFVLPVLAAITAVVVTARDARA